MFAELAEFSLLLNQWLITMASALHLIPAIQPYEMLSGKIFVCMFLKGSQQCSLIAGRRKIALYLHGYTYQLDQLKSLATVF